MAGEDGAESVMNLDTFLTEINRTYGRPALVAGVTDQDRLRAAGAIGVRRLGHDVPVTVQDQFHIGSVGKAIAGTVIAVLVDQGRLSWETTPADVFPDLAATMDPAFREVGIVRFLTHQAGLAPFTEDAEWLPFAAWSSPPREQRRAFTAHLLRRPPAVPPGTEFLYSNAGFTVAAAMAERVTGHLWEALVQASIFTPLEMGSAGFGWPAPAQRDAPWGHWVTDQGFQPDPPEDALRLGPLLGPAGDLHMNVADLARFARVHLRGLAGQDSVVQATSIRTLYRALGYDARGAQKVGYVGSAGTFTAVLVLMPPRNQALVLMTNAGDDADSALAILAQLTGCGYPTIGREG